MFANKTFFLAAFAAASQLAAAQTPGCLLAAVNAQPNPADVKSICGKSSDLNTAINKACGNNWQAAKDSFNQICKDAGVQVTLSGGPSSSTSGSSTATGTAKTSATGSLTTTTTGTAASAGVTGSQTTSASTSSKSGGAVKTQAAGLSLGAVAIAGLAIAL